MRSLALYTLLSSLSEEKFYLECPVGTVYLSAFSVGMCLHEHEDVAECHEANVSGHFGPQFSESEAFGHRKRS